MRIPEQKIEEITGKTDIVEVIGQYLTLTRKGGRYWGLCPFHHEKTPSFSVNPERGVFYCFGCGKGGSAFTFLMEMEKVTFIEAVKILAEKAGVAVDALNDESPGHTKREAMFELLGRVAGSLAYILKNGEHAAPAKEYIVSRGITPEIIDKYQLGYAPKDRSWLFRFLKSRNYSDEFLAETGLFSTRYPGKSFFSDRLIFPIFSHRGPVIAFGGRSLTNNEPKYLNSPETSFFKKGEQLYGLYQGLQVIRKAREFYLVEGYVDVLAMAQAGIGNTVAPLGTSFTDNQARLLKRFADTAVLLFDGDSAGIKATERAIGICESAGLNSLVVEMPAGTDPADILKNDGPEALKNSLKYRINSFEYLLKSVVSRHDAGTPEGKEFAINDLFSYIERIDSEVKREGCIELIAQALDVEKKSVLRDVARRGKQAVSFISTPVKKKNAYSSIDLYLMLAVIANREYFSFVRTMLSSDDIEEPGVRDIYIALEEAFRNEEDSVELLLTRIEHPELKNLILEKLATEEYSINSDKIVRDTVFQIKRRSLEKKRARVESQLRKVGMKSGVEAGLNLKELLSEKMYLDGELEKLKVNGNDRHTN